MSCFGKRCPGCLCPLPLDPLSFITERMKREKKKKNMMMMIMMMMMMMMRGRNKENGKEEGAGGPFNALAVLQFRYNTSSYALSSSFFLLLLDCFLFFLHQRVRQHGGQTAWACCGQRSARDSGLLVCPPLQARGCHAALRALLRHGSPRLTKTVFLLLFLYHPSLLLYLLLRYHGDYNNGNGMMFSR